MRYLRCISCKMVLDTHTNVMVVAGITTTGAQKTEQQLANAIAQAEPFKCEACRFVADHIPVSWPPDPSTYSPLNR